MLKMKGFHSFWKPKVNTNLRVKKEGYTFENCNQIKLTKVS